MFWKGSHRCLTAGKNLKLAQHYYNHYKYFPSDINVSVCSAQRQMFVIACIFEIMQFYNIFTNENYRTFYPSGIYLLKVNNRNSGTRCNICRKKTSNDVVLVILLLTLYIVLVNSIEFEQVNAG